MKKLVIETLEKYVLLVALALGLAILAGIWAYPIFTLGLKVKAAADDAQAKGYNTVLVAITVNR